MTSFTQENSATFGLLITKELLGVGGGTPFIEA